MRPHLPPLNALKAFEAAARHESFTRAAEELCVTQGAVSHQVKALEAELAIKLFNRERQRLIITEAGRDYLTVVRDALDRIAIGTERLLQRQNAGVLTVSTSPSPTPISRSQLAQSERLSRWIRGNFSRSAGFSSLRRPDNSFGLHTANNCSELSLTVSSPGQLPSPWRTARSTSSRAKST